MSLAEFTELIEMIPGTFWGIVVGSFFTLCGVFLTNRANSKRMEGQFRNERELQTKDTELALRKEVSLAAAEAISAGLRSVVSFGNLDIPLENVTAAWTDKSPVIAKMQIITSEPTLRAMTELSGELAAIFVKLTSKRLPLMSLKEQIKISDAQIASFSRERDRMLEEMKQYNLEGKIDVQRWNAIEKKL